MVPLECALSLSLSLSAKLSMLEQKSVHVRERELILKTWRSTVLGVISRVATDGDSILGCGKKPRSCALGMPAI